MIEGTCLCGDVRWHFDGLPDTALSCNCTACRRYGVLWAYDYDGERITVDGPTTSYTRGPNPSLAFRFCPRCGCLMAWRATAPHADGRWRIAVNLRMAEPGAVGVIPVERLDGLETWKHLPDDGRTVGDHWF